MQRRFRQVFTSLKENTCVSYAKIATVGGFCDIELILVKATCPKDLPLRERYINELLKIFSISPPSYREFSTSFVRRFSKTQCWRVALKCLILLHRLLRALPNDSPFRAELLYARSNGFLPLNPCHFRDCSSSASEDYTAFIRSYAHLLDEALDCLSIDCKETDIDDEKEDDEREVRKSLRDKMKELGGTLETLPQVQGLIDRVMDCRPTGAVARSFLVHSAMKYIIRDSFVCYTTFRKEIVAVLDHLMEMPYRSCIAAFSVYQKAAVQANQLCEFYDLCKSMGLCGLYEYPFIDQIPDIQIQALYNFVNGMWQLTESSSSTEEDESSLTSRTRSPFSTTEDDEGDKQLVRFDYGKKFEENAIVKKVQKEEEMEPLIQLDVVEDNVGWETLLEASVCSLLVVSKNYYFGHNSKSESVEAANGWEMQVYNAFAVTPFHQPNNMITHYNGSLPSNPTYPWGL